MTGVTGTDARHRTTDTPMLDIVRLRTSVTTGQYVVDPLAVADALLSRAGIATPTEPPAGGEAISRDGARSPEGPAPPRPHA